jgi:hypothetical protein
MLIIGGMLDADVIAVGLMSKSRGRKRPPIPTPRTRLPPLPPAAAGAPLFPLGYDPNGPMEQRDVVNSKDGWSEFTLDDDTVIRTKVAMIDVKRAVGQFNQANGDPMYVLQMTIVTNVKAPDRLKKQSQK